MTDTTSTTSTTDPAPLCMNLAEAQPGQLVVQFWGSPRNRTHCVTSITKVWKNGIMEVNGRGGRSYFKPDGTYRGGDMWSSHAIRAFHLGETPADIVALENQRVAAINAAEEERQRQREAFFAEVKAGNPTLNPGERVACSPRDIWRCCGFARNGEPLTYLYVIRERADSILPQERFRAIGWLVSAGNTEEVTGEGPTLVDALLVAFASKW